MSGQPFIGSEAIATGQIPKHLLRTRYRPVFPGVYAEKNAALTLHDRAYAAWLWSRRSGVIMGLTAAGLHGSKWLDEDLPIELMWSNARPPSGIRTRCLTMRPEERMRVGGLPVTSPARTAFDVGRCAFPTHVAVGRMDALFRATGLSVDEVATIAARHRGVPGLRKLETVLSLVDVGAQSPKETWLRLVLVRAGLPRPRTQIPVVVGGWTKYYLDMGWEDVKVAVEYDGEHHRTDRLQYARDSARREELERLGWIVIRVLVGDTSENIVWRVRDAITRRQSVLR
ncbi:endonuclease domain-containing protein [Mycolicibacterium sphagni]|uniref:endonuclease domain-containing protein n=1 Tax=Mycolicibacterium sphagni TaxID=1786 RepID=UPI003975BFC5